MIQGFWRGRRIDIKWQSWKKSSLSSQPITFAISFRACLCYESLTWTSMTLCEICTPQAVLKRVSRRPLDE